MHLPLYKVADAPFHIQGDDYITKHNEAVWKSQLKDYKKVNFHPLDGGSCGQCGGRGSILALK